MSVLGALFLVPIAALLLLYLYDSWSRIGFLRSEIGGVAYLEKLWPDVVWATRGVALPNDSRTAEPLEPGAEALGLEAELIEFERSATQTRPRAGVSLIAAIADKSKLTLDTELDTYYLGDAISEHLPKVTLAVADLEAAFKLPQETPGRASRISQAVDHLRISAIDADDDLAKAAQYDPTKMAIRSAVADQRRTLLGVLDLANQIGAKHADERSVLTKLPQLRVKVDTSWRSSQRELTARLDERLEALELALAIWFIIIAVSVTTAGGLGFAIHRGVDRKMALLLEAMARLGEGDLESRVPFLDDRNEFGKIAQTVEAFRLNLIEREELIQESVAAARVKTEFLGNISHEIRTPLNGVIGVASALGATDLSQEQRGMVELIQTSGQTAERLLSDVLDISKIEAGGLQLESAPIDLRRTVDNAVGLFQSRAAAKNLELVSAFEGAVDGVFEGDGVRLSQVVSNLVSNAIKFTDAGRVTCTTRITPNPRVSGACLLTITIEDTGIGFDPAAAGDLFERFTQADSSITRRFGGTGLGLSISKSIVELMQGEIEVTSTPGAGSQFRISAPIRCLSEASRPPLGSPARDAAEAAIEPQSALRILLVEDHDVNRQVVCLLLSPLGAEIAIACDGREGVERFAAGQFDLVLMDMQMPVMDGLAATEAIRQIERRQASSRTPIVMLTANVSREHELAAAAAGADRFLAKPITRDRLWDVVMSATGMLEGEELCASHAVA